MKPIQSLNNEWNVCLIESIILPLLLLQASPLLRQQQQHTHHSSFTRQLIQHGFSSTSLNTCHLFKKIVMMMMMMRGSTSSSLNPFLLRRTIMFNSRVKINLSSQKLNQRLYQSKRRSKKKSKTSTYVIFFKNFSRIHSHLTFLQHKLLNSSLINH